jgi:hypothetical protein
MSEEEQARAFGDLMAKAIVAWAATADAALLDHLLDEAPRIQQAAERWQDVADRIKDERQDAAEEAVGELCRWVQTHYGIDLEGELDRREDNGNRRSGTTVSAGRMVYQLEQLGLPPLDVLNATDLNHWFRLDWIDLDRLAQRLAHVARREEALALRKELG